jgi:hypothetical protein
MKASYNWIVHNGWNAGRMAKPRSKRTKNKSDRIGNDVKGIGVYE